MVTNYLTASSLKARLRYPVTQQKMFEKKKNNKKQKTKKKKKNIHVPNINDVTLMAGFKALDLIQNISTSY